MPAPRLAPLVYLAPQLLLQHVLLLSVAPLPVSSLLLGDGLRRLSRLAHTDQAWPTEPNSTSNASSTASAWKPEKSLIATPPSPAPYLAPALVPAKPPAKTPQVAPSPAPGAGWYNGGADESCIQACASRQLTCSEDAFNAHHQEVDTSDKVRKLIGKVGGETADTWCEATYGAYTPAYDGAECFRQPSAPQPTNYSCGAVPFPANTGKHRLCYCHPAEAGTGWYAAKPEQNCIEGCGDIGLLCTDQILAAHDPEVQGSDKTLAIINATGSYTTDIWCERTFGDYVPAFKLDECYSSPPSRPTSTISCEAHPFPPGKGKQRLCYCHKPLVPSPAPVPAPVPVVAAPPPAPAPLKDGWYDGGAEQSCAAGCGALGLTCSEGAMQAHLNEVDTSDKVLELIPSVGGNTQDTWCESTFGDYTPAWNGQECFRPPETAVMNCTSAPYPAGQGKHRLCYCNRQQAVEGWHAADEDQSCTDACDELGLLCTDGGLASHDGDVQDPQNVQMLINQTGAATSDPWCERTLGDYVPAFKSNECYSSAPGRTTFSCSALPIPAQVGKRRLCYCHGPTTPSPAPPPPPAAVPPPPAPAPAADPFDAGYQAGWAAANNASTCKVPAPPAPAPAPIPSPTPSPAPTPCNSKKSWHDGYSAGFDAAIKTTSTTTPCANPPPAAVPSPAPAPVAKSGWYDGGDGQSCDTGCAMHGLQCSDAAMREHLGEVSASDQVLAVIGSVGGNTSDQLCEPTYGNYVPAWTNRECYRAPNPRNPARAVVSCAAQPFPAGTGKHRLCYCTANPVPEPEGWVAGAADQSCLDACDQAGMVCSEQDFKDHYFEVNSAKAMHAAVAAVGGKSSDAYCDSTNGAHVPSWSSTQCFSTPHDPSLSNYSCAALPHPSGLGIQRLCYCSKPVPAPAPSPVVLAPELGFGDGYKAGWAAAEAAMPCKSPAPSPTPVPAPAPAPVPAPAPSCAEGAKSAWSAGWDAGWMAAGGTKAATPSPAPLPPRPRRLNGTEGWYDSGVDGDCHEGCMRAGLVCTDAAMAAHFIDVVDASQVLAIVSEVGGVTTDSWCEGTYGSYVPGWKNTECYRPPPDMVPTDLKCAPRPEPLGQGKHRLCYCMHASPSPAPAPSPTPPCTAPPCEEEPSVYPLWRETANAAQQALDAVTKAANKPSSQALRAKEVAAAAAATASEARRKAAEAKSNAAAAREEIHNLGHRLWNSAEARAQELAKRRIGP
mmetsp:Transcript_1341/g.3595  ORF Transcript_1341/g.3595 Transcript_1341/m.3595 type:complete len:1223 (+) Transcript_1341:127-3795(+)